MTQAQINTTELPPAHWQGGPADYPRDTPVHALFEAIAAVHPDAQAIVTASESITYAQLNAEANTLAAHILAHGIQPGTPVALCLPRSPGLIVTLLAILKAGACYVPLDPAYPAERLQLMAEDSGAPLIITTHAQSSSLSTNSTTPTLYLDDLPSTPPAPIHNSSFIIHNSPASPAYIMFTSGSTGRPKGVTIPHHAIVRLVRAQTYLGLAPTETFLQLAPASFDASTLEIWAPLLNGGRLAIAPPGTLSLDQIAATIRDLGVTSMWLTSGLFNLMADEQLDAFAPLTQLLAGGDILSIPHVRKVMAAHPHLRLINGYGPTESTTFACCHTITPADLTLPSIPIGTPIANTTVRILDDFLTPVPIGCPGELFIGGDGLALGYWNQPELTAEKFLTVTGERLYRTGDRVQWLPRDDGSVTGENSAVIQFLGRLDHQIKVRGYRIELGEIESALAHEPGVLRCVVIAIGDGADKQLAAYFAGSADPAALRDTLRQRLPDYMVPAFFTHLDSLPLTENGKVDRARLPSPSIPLHSSSSALPPAADIPQTDLERTLAALWSDILALPAPSLHANFFDLGGTSLKLVEAHSRLVRTLRRQIPVTAFFQYPTIAALAAYLTPSASGTISTPSRITAAADRARLQREALARKQLSQKVP